LLKFHVGTFDKFEGADRTLGLQMKSGEVMELDVRSRSTSQSTQS
jgi:carbamoylphosphate synthase large subunit